MGPWDLDVKAFNNGLECVFEDGSKLLFSHAFAVVDHERHELAVFTEHCGYHVFVLDAVETCVPEPRY